MLRKPDSNYEEKNRRTSFLLKNLQNRKVKPRDKKGAKKKKIFPEQYFKNSLREILGPCRVLR